MSLRVDLIYPNEQRSGGIVTLKSIVRVAAIIVPSIIALIIAWVVVNMMLAQSALNVLESRWASSEKRQKVAMQLAADLGRNRRILEQLNGWKGATRNWNKDLVAIIELTPKAIQLTSLDVTIIEPKTRDNPNIEPGRSFVMRITGRTSDAEAKQAIETLRNGLEQHPHFKTFVDTVEVTHYGADESDGAGPMDRVFEIEIVYNRLTFHETP